MGLRGRVFRRDGTGVLHVVRTVGEPPSEIEIGSGNAGKIL